MSQCFLIIDDDPLYTKLLTHRIGVANPDATIETLDPNKQGWPTNRRAFDHYDIIFLDYMLGEFDGIRCLAAIRRLTRKAYIVVVSGTTSERDAVLAVKEGADNYLPKQLLTPERIKDIIQLASSDQRDTSTASTMGNLRLNSTHGMRSRRGQLLFPRLDGYKIRRKIGVGGMATVYLAERQFDKMDVVIKVIDTSISEAEQVAERTRLEFKMISAIDHPNIIVIDEIHEQDELLFIVMEHFDAGDLKQRIEHRFSTIQAVKYLKEIASGLVAIEDKGCIHRDLKPSNIMFRSDGSLAIIDFSVAKSEHFDESITLQGEVVGTPYYMSPEQALSRDIDIRTDIYSLGIIFYEMLLGRKPYSAKDLQTLIRMQVNDPLPALPNHLQNFNEILSLMTAKSPDERFSSAAQLCNYLERY